jgi:hypothetical protein
LNLEGLVSTLLSPDDAQLKNTEFCDFTPECYAGSCLVGVQDTCAGHSVGDDLSVISRDLQSNKIK